MRVAVTGGTGHVGANVVRALLARGWSVRALVHDDATAIDGLPVEHVPGDVLKRDTLGPLFEGADLAFHLAGHITLDGREAPRAWSVNVEGTTNVLRAALDARVPRLVHFSSIHAYDDRPGIGPIDEERGPMVDPRRPCYGLTKAAGEQAVLEAVGRGLDAVIVNPTGVLGPHDYRGSRMGRTLMALARGTMPVVPRAGFDWVDARDVAEGAIQAALRGRRGQRYLLSGSWASLLQLGKLADLALEQRRTRLEVPLWVAWLGVPVDGLRSRVTGRTAQCTRDSIAVLHAESRASSAKAGRELGWAPRALAETVRDALSWQLARQEAPLPAALPGEAT
jgi:dihydroflavonol-4-reductase